MRAYAAIYDNEIREKSSSGGIFSLFASLFDVVYGVAMTKDCYGAEMVRIEGDVSSLRGSKYLQAKVGDTFKKVRDDLMAEKEVLFSGTGCQINGLQLFLGKEYENLTTVDIVCHGVPSPKLWKEYAKYQETKLGKVESVNFRHKTDGFGNPGTKDNQFYIPRDQDIFMQMFLRDYCLRPACYECHAKYYKTADITIADFWGIDIVDPEMYDGRGTSLVIIRTEKGQRLFEKIKGKIRYKEVRYEDALAHNPSESKSVNKPMERNDFYRDLDRLPFRKLSIKYVEGPLWKRTGRKAKKIIKKFRPIGKNKQQNNFGYGILFTFKKGRK